MTVIYHSDLESETINTKPVGWVCINSFNVLTWASQSKPPIGGSNGVFVSDDTTVALYTAVAASPDQAVRLAVRVPSLTVPNTFGVVLRADTGYNNRYRVTLDTNGTGLRLLAYIYQNGHTLLAASSSFGFTPAPTDIVHIEASVVGSVISGRAWIEGSTRPATISGSGTATATYATVTATNATITTGYPGLILNSVLSSYVGADNIVITDGAGGEDYFYTVDITAPTATSASVGNTTPTYVDIVMSEPMDTTTTPASSTVTVSGHTVTALSWLSSTVLRATVSAAFVSGEAARTVAYTQSGVNNARDVATNLLANFSGLAITNNAPAPDAVAPTMTGTMTSNTVTNTSFNINWAATTRGDNVGITGYEVSDNGTAWTDAGNVTSKSYSGMSAATAYTKYVRAYDAAGNKSTPALSINVTTASSADTTLPTMSGSITPSALAPTSCVITWPAGADNVAVIGYEVSTNGGTTFTSVGNVLTYSLTGLTSGTGYVIQVRAFDAAGNRSAPALSVSITTPTGGASITYTSAGKNIQGGKRLGVAHHVTIHDKVTRVLVATKTGLTTDASTGLTTFSHSALVAGTEYLVMPISDADVKDTGFFWAIAI